jgi:shikimate dehydrogenase
MDDLTRRVGAANTLRRTAEGWEATNTDVAGFLAPLEEAYPKALAGARAAVVGAGGSARAVVVALLSRGARVTVHARRREQARLLADALGIDAGAWPPPQGSWDILVNCTPLGGAGHRDESPIPATSLTGALVYDLTYGEGDSRLVREARAAGCVAIDGLPMLVAQAERQFEWWTGQKPEPGVMANAVKRRVERTLERAPVRGG